MKRICDEIVHCVHIPHSEVKLHVGILLCLIEGKYLRKDIKVAEQRNIDSLSYRIVAHQLSYSLHNKVE